MNKHLAVINVVGLSQALITQQQTPFLYALSQEKGIKSVNSVLPAVTTTAQSAMLTGKTATQHGIVGNGWYFEDLAEIGFWKQANQLVQQEKIWDVLKRENDGFTCANSFWWYNMYSTVDYSMTPRPHYPADGRKVLDLYSVPTGLHQSIEREIGQFPFFNFWGPKAGIASSDWIAKASIKVHQKYQPNLHLIYLPHLDYCLQKFGPTHPEVNLELKKIDKVVEQLCHDLTALNTEFVIVSEYSIRPVNKAVHINKVLRENNYIKVRESLSWELLDCGASAAFAVADHQVAHVYVNDKSNLQSVEALLNTVPGVEQVLDKEAQKAQGIAHERSGDFVLIADPDAWFTYYYWLDDKKAPDFARTVDIHRKPGYDPLEMYIDPDKSFAALKIAWTVLKKKLGFRYLMDVIPLDTSLIKGSHGRVECDSAYQPVIIFDQDALTHCNSLTDVYSLIYQYFNH